MIDFDFENQCYGCRACENRCPKKAITMQLNAEGFLMPFVDQTLCVNCGACEKVCPHLSPVENELPFSQRKTVAAFSMDIDNRKLSTSGGIFRPIAEWVLRRSGFVCGCVWNENLEAEHIVTNKFEDVIRMQGSKYVQSNINNCYEKIKKILMDGSWVLFSGTPCQVGGLLSFVGKRERLITIAVLCSGVPSPLVLKKNIEYIEKKYNGILSNLCFRYKSKLGWDVPIIRFEFKNRQPVEVLSHIDDLYMSAFLQGINKRKACYNCQYKKENVNADFYIGDFWGASNQLIKVSENKGLSVLILNSKRSELLWTSMNHSVHQKEILQDVFIQGNKSALFSKKMPASRLIFFEKINKLSFNDVVKPFLKEKRVEKYIKRALYRSVFFTFFRQMKKTFKSIKERKR